MKNATSNNNAAPAAAEATTKNVILCSPKTRKDVVFFYTGLECLGSLINFVGVAPQINIDMSLNFKKQVIKPNSVIFRNSFGEVINVMSKEKFNEVYETLGTFDFDDTYKNNVSPKEKKERKVRTQKK